MAVTITVHLQIFKRPQLPRFSTDIDETGIKIHGLLRSFILNIVMVRVAVPFNCVFTLNCQSSTKISSLSSPLMLPLSILDPFRWTQKVLAASK